MRRFAPFEPGPALAVAVSGGADSLALTLLAARWAAGGGGSLLALHVDHGLRETSCDEAAWLEGRLRSHGIACTILRWQGEKPAHGLQERARAERYRLLERACHERGILHLLLAHHADDQGETIAMRAGSGSTAHGLAGMAAVRELSHLRLLRPLLTLPKARLIATLEALGERWIEDPSNRDHRFWRARHRSGSSLPPADHGAADRRIASEREAARLLARTLSWHPLGNLSLERATLRAAHADIAYAVLADCLRTVGGKPYRPSPARLEALSARLGGSCPTIATLAGVIIEADERTITMAREPGRIDARPVLLEGPASLHWDGRFLIDISTGTLLIDLPTTQEVRRLATCSGAASLRPGAALASLPAIRSNGRLVAVGPIVLDAARAAEMALEIRLRPLRPLADACFGSAAP